MIILLFLLGKLLMTVSLNEVPLDCCLICTCFKGTLNCSRQALVDIFPTEEDYYNLDYSFNSIYELKRATLLPHVKNLNISHNRLRKFDLDFTGYQLISLIISDNPLKQVKIESTTLKFLDVSWCAISHLESNFLNTLPALEILDISHNPLKVIHPFSGQIKELYISHCSFRKILFNLPQLELLDISYNKYMTVLQLESNLSTLKAAHGTLHEIQLSTPNLGIFDISHNRLSQVYFNNPNLKSLDISWNSLRSLDLIDVTLTKLDLSHNLLQELELAIDDLLHLNVSFNPLATLKVHSTRLDIIDCTSCHLKHLDLPPVHTLNLSRNGLEEFRGDATFLDLSNNLLDTYTGRASLVDLRGNRLSLPKRVTITGRALLNNNPWLCKCEDNYLKDLYIRTLDRVTCASPEGRTWDDCYITKLPRYMKDYTWVPMVASGFLTVLIIISMYAIKKKLWPDRRPNPPQSHTLGGQDVEEVQPIRERADDRLPSYEEALFMNKPNYSNRRSYEIVPTRTLSSISI